jgi:VIT1/CCC1 family predicted Fe2+/Mn2+ transporter
VNIAQSLENLRLEQDAVVLYEALASIEKDPRRAAAFRHIAANEQRHADIWTHRLHELGATVPPPAPPRPRVRLIILVARVLGTRAVSDLVKSLEGDEVAAYDDQEPTAEIASIAADEREHAAIWERLDRPAAEPEADEPEPDEDVEAADAGLATAADDGTGVPVAGTAGETAAPGREDGAPPGEDRAPRRDDRAAAAIAGREGWHRTARSGTLRAIIFGVSDGLVSNLALVMGVAGASGEAQFVLLAGIAGLLAGSCSMAAGEYISMQSQRELFERQIQLERAELEAMPDEEQRELAEIYESKGIPRAEADRMAERLFRDPEAALDTLVREELGLDPDELGSPWGAAAGSFIAFATGAIVPVIPYLVLDGAPAFVASIVVSLAALFGVGAAVSLLTGKGALFSGLRQLAIGAAAAGVTYAVGTIIGVGVAG